jgi:hypothetical protein
MPIKAILQNIDGTRRVSSVVDAEGGLNRCLPFGDQSFPLFQYVDPYGNVVFNPLQMPQLLVELELLLNRATDQELRLLLEKVRQLAIQCRGSNHLYLRLGLEALSPPQKPVTDNPVYQDSSKMYQSGAIFL